MAIRIEDTNQAAIEAERNEIEHSGSKLGVDPGSVSFQEEGSTADKPSFLGRIADFFKRRGPSASVQEVQQAEPVEAKPSVSSTEEAVPAPEKVPAASSRPSEVVDDALASLQEKATQKGLRRLPTGPLIYRDGRFVKDKKLLKYANELVVDDATEDDYEFTFDGDNLVKAKLRKAAKQKKAKEASAKEQPNNQAEPAGQVSEEAREEPVEDAAGMQFDTTARTERGDQRKKSAHKTSYTSSIPLTARELIDNFSKSLFYSTQRAASDANFEAYNEARSGDETLSFDDWAMLSDDFDAESFAEELEPLMRSNVRRNAQYATGVEGEEERLEEEYEEAEIQEAAERDIGFKVQDNRRLWRLLDQTVWDLKVGFFHVFGEKFVTDPKTGMSHIEWPKQVEEAMGRIMGLCGLRGLEGQRTVFRMVRLYATMTVDRSGRMFNMSNKEWSLTIDEFVGICKCMEMSAKKFGNPFCAPWTLSSNLGVMQDLRGTLMFPSGVIPRVVCDAITGPDSLLSVDGHKISSGELAAMAHEEWVNVTQPVMNATLNGTVEYVDRETGEITEKNLYAQRVVIENALQAFARLDGIDADQFGEAFNIDTAQHYKVWEYENSQVEYAKAVGDLYDGAAVDERAKAKSQEYQIERERDKNSRTVTNYQQAANLFTSGIKTNALWWNVPIRVSAIAERGIGNLQTRCTLGTLRHFYKDADKYEVPQEIAAALATKDGYRCLDAAYLLLEMGGPGALTGFSQQKTPMALTPENALKYLHDYVMPSVESSRLRDWQENFNNFSRKIMMGGECFRKGTSMNFLTALMVSNQATADVQSRLAENGELDDYAGMSLTGEEMLNTFRAHNGDVCWWLTEIVNTNAGRDALMMMNANNISHFNVVSYNVNKMLRKHAVGNALITAFLDSFPGYGVNFLITMIPGSKTLMYLGCKAMDGRSITAADFAIGGGFGERHNGRRLRDDPGFVAGLKMNLWFDAIQLGKWASIGMILGGALHLLGFEPPDDPEDRANISKWKIGGNLGWGPDTDGDGEGNGIEINLAYWLNDLTQFGLPNAYAIALTLGGYDRKTIDKCYLDSLYDQMDGNVVLDIIDLIKNWGDDVVEMDMAMKDPTFKLKKPDPMFSMCEILLNGFGKIVPGAPLMRAYSKSAAMVAGRGPNALMFSTSQVYDRSSEWAIEAGKTNYVEDPNERILRKYSAGNWLLGGILDFLHRDDKGGTGYQWWEMPPRSYQEPAAAALASLMKMDYDNMDGMGYYEYRAQRTDDLISIIGEYPDPETAIRAGFFIPGDIREAALNTLYSEYNEMKADYEAKKDMQYWANDYERNEWYNNVYKPRNDEIFDIINNWLKNDNIPTWSESYVQLLSDYDISYLSKEGSPVSGAEALLSKLNPFEEDPKEIWALKGNSPTSLVPFTTVNYGSDDRLKRGWSGETRPVWDHGDTHDYSMLHSIENQVIKTGRNAGSTIGDVYFGEEYDGQRLHPEEATIGTRAMVPKKITLPEELRMFGPEDADGGIYGQKGIALDDNGNPVKEAVSGEDAAKGNASTSSENPVAEGSKGAMTFPSMPDVDDLAEKIIAGILGTPGWMASTILGNLGGGGDDDQGSGEPSGNTPGSGSGTPAGGADSGSDGIKVGDDSEDSNESSKPWPYSNYTTYPSYSYNYGGRSNPGGYNIKIYSTGRSANPDRASTMYARTPTYSPNGSYINPGFSTKGSREAYKRQDI